MFTFYLQQVALKARGDLNRPQLSGSTEIIEHLFNTYGPGAANIPGSLKGGLNLFKNSRSSVRKNARPDNTKMRPITLYGWEGANFVRQVRVALTELGIAHVMINCAEGSVNRSACSQKVH